MALNKQQAEQELYTDNYNVWKKASPAVNSSNSSSGCSQISQDIANYLRGTWAPNAGPNSWNQTSADGYKVSSGSGDDIVRWVSRSVSGGGTVVDFHALWRDYTFLRHFQIV